MLDIYRSTARLVSMNQALQSSQQPSTASILTFGSIDDTGAKKSGKPATVVGTAVYDLQTDLEVLGYAAAKGADGIFGNGTQRSGLRFQRTQLVSIA